VTRSNVTYGKLESFNKTDGLFDGAANIEVVDGDLARGTMSTRTLLGSDPAILRNMANRKAASALCRVGGITCAMDRSACLPP